jgi:hypothetical protein
MNCTRPVRLPPVRSVVITWPISHQMFGDPPEVGPGSQVLLTCTAAAASVPARANGEKARAMAISPPAAAAATRLTPSRASTPAMRAPATAGVSSSACSLTIVATPRAAPAQNPCPAAAMARAITASGA